MRIQNKDWPQCPHCGTHINPRNFTKHAGTLGICSVLKKRREEQSQTYYVKDVNADPMELEAAYLTGTDFAFGGSKPSFDELTRARLSKRIECTPPGLLRKSQFDRLIARLESAVLPVRKSHRVDETALAVTAAVRAEAPLLSHAAKKRRKHALQHAALCAQLRETASLRRETTLVEFGAGKAELSKTLALTSQRLHGDEGVRVVCVDMQNFRHKCERVLQERARRLRVNLRHLDLRRVPWLVSSLRVDCVAKHLCGCGTDYALRSLRTALQGDTKVPLGSLVISLCCHHKCTWASFCGRAFLQQHGINNDRYQTSTKHTPKSQKLTIDRSKMIAHATM
ncbi:MAG: hypothetical protein MHM6MM_001874 [Cercozoa sp. M6MM]